MGQKSPAVPGVNSQTEGGRRCAAGALLACARGWGLCAEARPLQTLRVPQSPFSVPILVSFLWEMKQLLALWNSI